MKTKYKIGQEVWYLHGKPVKGTITKITIFSGGRTHYEIGENRGGDEDVISDTKEGLKELIFN